MSEEDDLFDLREAMRLANALNDIHLCRSIKALEALKGEADKRISELERAGRLIEQNAVKTRQTAQKPEQTEGKTEPGKKHDGALNPLQHLDVILRDAKEPFTQGDISDILYNHYKKTLHHEISHASADSYAHLCVKRMLSESLIEDAGKKERKGYGRCALLYKKKT